MMKMLLEFGAADRTEFLNLRFKGVFTKGFAVGGVVTPSNSNLTVSISPFALVTFDGTVVRETDTVVANVASGVRNYVVVRARYRFNQTALLALQVLSETAYNADAEKDWLHVLAVVDLATGGPYSFPPASSVSTVERDEIDPISRASWRAPVATLGELPLVNNRHGDTRLCTDTGSLHWWNEDTSTWEIFDEVPLTHHRATEHSNGLIAQSVSTSLEPGVSGTNLTVQAVPAGSGYTVNGRFVAAPATNQSIAASTAGSNRGLLQLGYDQNGAATLNYRVARDADALDLTQVRILNISDGHPTGTFSLLYSAGLGYSWAGGQPGSRGINERFRLFTSGGNHWVDVVITGADPVVSVSDNYIVNASLKSESSFLVGYWFWAGATTLVLGTDKRVWGTLGYPEMSSDFKEDVINAVVVGDTRRDGVIMGGELINDLGTLSARIVGPIIAVVGGKRMVVPGSYSGFAFPPNDIVNLFVDETGALVTSGFNPPEKSAMVAQVTTDGSTITAISDERRAVLVAGAHEGHVSVRMGKDSLFYARTDTNDRRVFATAGPVGDIEGTALRSGILMLEESRIEAGPLEIRDDLNGVSNTVNSNAFPAVAAVLPGAAAPSIVEAIVAASEVATHGVGFLSPTDCAITTSVLNVNLSAGSLLTFAGMRMKTTGVTLDTSTVPTSTTAYIYYNSTTKAFVVSTTKPTWKRDILVCVFTRTGSAVTLVDARPIADGTKMLTSVSVGFTGSNFGGLRGAVAFLCAYNRITSGLLRSPNTIVIKGGDSLNLGQDTVDLGAFYGDSFDELTIRGAENSKENTVYWGEEGVTSTTPLLNLRGLVNGFNVHNVIFGYAGIGGASDSLSWVKDPKKFSYEDVTVSMLDPSAGNGLRHIQWRSIAYSDTLSVSKVTRCNFNAVSGADSAFFYNAACSERINFDGSTVAMTVPAFEDAAASIFRSTAAVGLDLSFNNCVLEARTTWFSLAASSTSHVNITGGELYGYGANGIMGANVEIDVYGARVRERPSTGAAVLTLTGVNRFESINTVGTNITVIGAVTTRFINCDVQMSGRFSGIYGTRATLADSISPTTTEESFLSNSKLSRVGGGAILVVGSSAACTVADSTLTYSGTLVDDPLTAAIAVSGSLRANNVRLLMDGRTSTALTITGVNGTVFYHGGSINTGGGKVTDCTPTGAPALDRDISGFEFSNVDLNVAHIPDDAGAESYAFNVGTSGTLNTPQTTYISFFRMRGCRLRFDTPWLFGIFQTAKVEVDDNRITSAISNNTLAVSGSGRMIFGSNTAAGVADVDVGATFSVLLSFSDNEFNMTRANNVGLAAMNVEFNSYHTMKIDDNDLLSLATVASSTLNQFLKVLITPHYQQSVTAFPSMVAVNRNKVRAFTQAANATQDLSTQIECLSLGGGIAVAGVLAANGNMVVSHAPNGGFTGATLARFTFDEANATIATVDNNTVRASPNAAFCELKVPATANIYAGTANLLSDGTGTGSLTGTFVEANTAV